MKSGKKSIKKQIKKRIEISSQTKMGFRDGLKVGGKLPPKPLNVGLVGRHMIRTGVKKRMPEPIVYPIKDYGEYIKPETVDVDVVIYISSFNRYKKTP